MSRKNASEQEQGAIAPGRRADILLLNDLKDPHPVGVMAKGKWVQVEFGTIKLKTVGWVEQLETQWR